MDYALPPIGVVASRERGRGGERARVRPRIHIDAMIAVSRWSRAREGERRRMGRRTRVACDARSETARRSTRATICDDP